MWSLCRKTPRYRSGCPVCFSDLLINLIEAVIRHAVGGCSVWLLRLRSGGQNARRTWRGRASTGTTAIPFRVRTKAGTINAGEMTNSAMEIWSHRRLTPIKDNHRNSRDVQTGPKARAPHDATTRPHDPEIDTTNND